MCAECARVLMCAPCTGSLMCAPCSDVCPVHGCESVCASYEIRTCGCCGAPEDCFSFLGPRASDAIFWKLAKTTAVARLTTKKLPNMMRSTQ
jgi:hypothetical protein